MERIRSPDFNKSLPSLSSDVLEGTVHPKFFAAVKQTVDNVVEHCSIARSTMTSQQFCKAVDEFEEKFYHSYFVVGLTTRLGNGEKCGGGSPVAASPPDVTWDDWYTHFNEEYVRRMFSRWRYCTVNLFRLTRIEKGEPVETRPLLVIILEKDRCLVNTVAGLACAPQSTEQSIGKPIPSKCEQPICTMNQQQYLGQALHLLRGTMDQHPGQAVVVGTVVASHVGAILAALRNQLVSSEYGMYDCPDTNPLKLVGAVLGYNKPGNGLPGRCDCFAEVHELNAFVEKMSGGVFREVVESGTPRCIVSVATQKELFTEKSMFDDNDTGKRPFGGKQVMVDTMVNSEASLRFVIEADGMMGVVLNFKSGNFLVVVGHANRDVSTLDEEEIARVWHALENASPASCVVVMPKYDIATGPEPVTQLMLQHWQKYSPGLVELFKESFDGISCAANITTNEAGTECSACYKMYPLSMMRKSPPVVEFKWPHYQFVVEKDPYSEKFGRVNFCAYVSFD